MQTMMWDCELHNNRLELLNNRNPYAPDTFEYVCVQYVIDNIKTFTKDRDYDIKGILRELVNANIVQSFDPWNLYDLPLRALWLARFSGCVSLHASEGNKGKTPKFAVFLETGMVNLLKETGYTQYLAEMADTERRHALWEVTYIAQILAFICNLPHMTVDSANQILINNLDTEWFKRTHELKIPINSFSSPASTDSWVKIHSRGIFHHLGDEMAFLMAAHQYGECYIVGRDEFGDLVVLGKMPGARTYSNFQRVNIKNFDYIYSTPKGSEMYPSKITMVASDNDDCRINSVNNSVLENAFWRNDIFKKHAGRELRELTINQFMDLLWDNQQEVFARPEFAIHKTVFSELLNEQKMFDAIEKIEDLADYRQHKALIVYEDVNLNADTNSNDNEENPLKEIMHPAIHCLYQDKEGNQHELFPENEEIMRNQDQSLAQTWSKVLERKVYVLTLNGLYLTARDALQKLSSLDKDYNIKSLKALIKLLKNEHYHLHHSNGAKEVLSNIFKNIVSKLEEYLKLEHLLDENLEKELIKANHYFYKTIAHKVHCEIINPETTNSCGFFLKNDGHGPADALYISLIHFIRCSYALYNKVSNKKTKVNNYTIGDIGDLFKKYAISRLQVNTHKGDRYHMLLDYWKDLDIPAVMVSDVIDMQNEYRIFMINGRPVTASPCYRNSTPFDAWQNGRFDPRLCIGHSAKETMNTKETRSRVARYAQFARKFGQEIKQAHPEIINYVLDVAWCEDLQKVVPIEINSITWSGAYQINMHRLCAAIAGKPFTQEAMDVDKNGIWSFNNIKEEARMKMLLDKVITQDQFDEFILKHHNRYQRNQPSILSDQPSVSTQVMEIEKKNETVDNDKCNISDKIDDLLLDLDLDEYSVDWEASKPVGLQNMESEQASNQVKEVINRIVDDIDKGDSEIFNEIR
jgi:hypothetical protein